MHTLKRLGGRLCLDFANTVDRDADRREQEYLTRYADLVAWSQHARILNPAQGQHLLHAASLQIQPAKAVFEEAIALRELIYRLFSAVAAHQTIASEDLVRLNLALSQSLPWLQVANTNDGFRWTWAEREDRLDSMLWQVVRSTAELLTAQELKQVRECAGEFCGWLFIDTSRNRSRRWCDMETCGNRHKAKRHYDRRRQAAE